MSLVEKVDFFVRFLEFFFGVFCGILILIGFEKMLYKILKIW